MRRMVVPSCPSLKQKQGFVYDVQGHCCLPSAVVTFPRSAKSPITCIWLKSLASRVLRCLTSSEETFKSRGSRSLTLTGIVTSSLDTEQRSKNIRFPCRRYHVDYKLAMQIRWGKRLLGISYYSFHAIIEHSWGFLDTWYRVRSCAVPQMGLYPSS